MFGVRARRELGLGARILGVSLALGAIAAEVRAADPTAEELHFLYEVNRARHDPSAWAAEYGLGSVTGGDNQPVTLTNVEPRPPLALNSMLVDSSRSKGQEMATHDYFGHASPVPPNNYWPNERARAFGYPLPTLVPLPGGGGSFAILGDDSNQIESIACGFGSPDPVTGLARNYAVAVNAVIGLIVDRNVPTLGHRVHLLATDDFSSVFVEAGAGFGSNAAASCRNYWAFHTGVRADVVTFLGGVVFADGNGNDRFDPGEGLAGVTVDAGVASALTGASGGYAIQVPGGTHDVTCSGGAFAGTASASVTAIGFNRQVDCVSGQSNAWVDFVPAPEPDAGALGLVAASALMAGRRLHRPRR